MLRMNEGEARCLGIPQRGYDDIFRSPSRRRRGFAATRGGIGGRWNSNAFARTSISLSKVARRGSAFSARGERGRRAADCRSQRCERCGDLVHGRRGCTSRRLVGRVLRT